MIYSNSIVSVQVGTFKPTSGLRLTSPIIFYNELSKEINSIESSCFLRQECLRVCGTVPTETDPTKEPLSPTNASKQSSGLVAGLVVLAILSVISVTIVVVILCCVYRRKRIPFLGTFKRDQNVGKYFFSSYFC